MVTSTLLTKLKGAVRAIEEAPTSMQRRPQIKKAKQALTLAIQDLDEAPGPSPNPNN